jgi:hypothetical protein
MRNSFEIVNCSEFLVKMSLESDVEAADVNDEEIEVRRSSVSWDCWRASNIWSTKSNDWISDENFFERYNLRLTNSNEIVISLKDSREWRNAKLDDKLKIFFNETIIFLKSNRSMIQDSDYLFFSMNLSRIRMNFEIIEKKYRSVTSVTKNFVSIATRFENLWSVRKKSLNWKQISTWWSAMNCFINELEAFLKNSRNDWDEKSSQFTMRILSLWKWCEKNERKKKKWWEEDERTK